MTVQVVTFHLPTTSRKAGRLYVLALLADIPSQEDVSSLDAPGGFLKKQLTLANLSSSNGFVASTFMFMFELLITSPVGTVTNETRTTSGPVLGQAFWLTFIHPDGTQLSVNSLHSPVVALNPLYNPDMHVFVTLNVPMFVSLSCRVAQSDVSEPRSEQSTVDHVPTAFANTLTSSGVTEPPPVTCTQAVEFGTSWLLGFLKLQVTRAKRAASEGFLTLAVSIAFVLTCTFDGRTNDSNERFSPLITLNALPAAKECCRVAEAQLVDALTVQVVTFHTPTIFANIGVA